jgi:DNA-binding transcriptional LysR family regulator
VADAHTAGKTRPVTLSVSTSLATYWLAPRLPEFKLAHPDVQLRVITTDSDAGVGRDDADLWIPLGPIDDHRLDSVDFCTEELIPVAAPALASTIDGAAGPAALLDQPLLHLEERYVPRYDWARWFANFGIETATTLSGVRSNDYSLILHAALSGNGLALGWRHIVDALLVDGSLVAVGPTVETGSSFPLLRRADRPLALGTAALHSWLLSENGREAGSEDPASLRKS